MKKSLSLIIFILLDLSLLAQNETNNWVLGQCRIDFNSESPDVFLDNAIFYKRGSASISDHSGNLLFYTDGVSIWNKEHNLMPNGSDLIPSPQGSSTQESIFIPFPGNPSQYYLLTVDPWNGHATSGLYYSVVDVSLDNGNGDIVLKGTRILENSTNMITAGFHQNQQDIWILAHKYNTNEYYSFLVTSEGISDSPVVSELGSIHDGWGGQLKLSPDGQFLALSNSSEILFARFDDVTGSISDEIVIPGTSYSGLEFSSDARKVYVTSGNNVYMFDISTFEKEAIDNSIRQVGIRAIFNGLRQIQLASNGNIYVTKGGGQVSGAEYFGIISSPNEDTPEFIELGLYLNGARSSLYTPNFIQSYLFKTSFNYQGTCQSSPTYFRITNTHLLESALWDFGDGFTSTEIYPEHTFDEPGIYTVTLTANYADHSDIITKDVTINPFPILELGEDIELCFGSKLSVEDSYTSYSWNTSDTTNTTRVTNSGYYVIEVTNEFGCKSKDSLYVDVIELPAIDLPDTLILESNALEVNPGEFSSYSWSTGESSQSISISETGWYSLLVTNGFGCESSKSFYVSDSSELTTESSRWIRLNPKPTSLTGRDVAFVDDYNGFIVNSEQLLFTKDQGNSWDEFMPLDHGFRISFKQGYGYIIGQTGSIYKSTYNGGGWNQIDINLNSSLNSITQLSKDSIFITSDNTLFKSFDGGESWKEIGIPNVDVEDSYFVNKNIGHVACRNGTILKTTDGGETWYETETSNTFPSDFFRITFINELVGYATQEHDDVYRTTDGGETWHEIASLDAGYALHFIDENIGFITGEYGATHKTQDGGETWSWIGFDGRIGGNDLQGIYFVNEDIGFATGLRGRIIRTFDGGNSWENYSLTYNTIADIEIESDEIAYALVGNDILKTIDKGAKWINLGSASKGQKTSKIDFISSSIGFAIAGGTPGTSASSNHVFKSIDGGVTWSRQNVGEIEFASSGLGSIKFIDENTGFVSGSRNQIFKTVDSGVSWTEVNSPGNEIKEFQFIDNNVGYAINTGNYYGRLYKTIDTGENWKLVYEDEGDEIYSMHFINSEVGFLIGDPELELRKTNDGGDTWEVIDIPYEWYKDIYFHTENYGFIFDEEGRVYETLDGGLNWEILDELSGITHVSTYQDEIFVYGGNGNILRSTITLSDQLKFSLIGVTKNSSTVVTISGELLSSIDDILVTLELIKAGSDVEEIELGMLQAGIETLELVLSKLEENSSYIARFKAKFGNEEVYSQTVSFDTDPILAADIDTKAKVSIYPNPTNGFLKIDGFENLIESVIINLNGVMVKKESTKPDFLDLSDLVPGHYILMLNGEKSKISRHIIVR